MVIEFGNQKTIQNTLPYRGNPLIDVQIQPKTLVTGTSSLSTLTFWDTVVNRATFLQGTVAQNYQILVSNNVDLSSWRSNTPFAQVDQTGFVTVLSSSTPKIKFSINGNVYGIEGTDPAWPTSVSNPRPARIISNEALYLDTFVSFITGTLVLSAFNAVETILSSLSCAPAVNLGQFHPQLSYYTNNNRNVRNTGCWLSGIDLSFYSINRTKSGGRASLIAPDVAATATHYLGELPDDFTWSDSNGNTYTRTVSSYININGTDITLLKLSSSLPSSVKPVKVIPQNFSVYNIPDLTLYPYLNTNAPTPTPLYWTNKVVVAQDYKVVPVVSEGLLGFKARTDNWRGLGYNGLSDSMVVGDSSSPHGILLNNDFILIGLQTWSNGSKNSFSVVNNNNLSSLGSIYTLTHPNLSGFPSRA